MTQNTGEASIARVGLLVPARVGLLVPVVYLGRRVCRLYGSKMAINVVGVRGSFRYNPTVAGLQLNRLPFNLKRGFPFQNEADHFVVACNVLLFLRITCFV